MAKKTAAEKRADDPRVIGYCRVSTNIQAEEGISLEVQDSKIRAWSALHDRELVAMHVDAGASAETLDRSAVQDALRDLRKKRARGLVVVKLDRLTRSIYDLSRLLNDYFSGDRFDLISIQEAFDTHTANGRFFVGMVGLISQWERETIGERVKDALAHLAAQGVQLGGTPLGMERLEEVDGEGRRILRPRKDEQATVRRILALTAAGKSLREIAATLAEESRQTKRGGRWQAQTISNIIERAKRST